MDMNPVSSTPAHLPPVARQGQTESGVDRMGFNTDGGRATGRNSLWSGLDSQRVPRVAPFDPDVVAPTRRTDRAAGTKIVATIGPASSDLKVLVDLAREGLSIARLNFSHGAAETHIANAVLLRSAADLADRPVQIMADLQGPKLRVGSFEHGAVMLEPGKPFILDPQRTALGDQEGVSVAYDRLHQDVMPQDRLLLADGLIALRVTSVQGTAVHTIVEEGGQLSDKKGLNKEGGGLSAPALTPKDLDDLDVAAQLRADWVAVSFPRGASDMEYAREAAAIAGERYGWQPKLMAKIERNEAVQPDALPGLVRASDGVMVARGDLGVEVGLPMVPGHQRAILAEARRQGTFGVVATQMMLSMVKSPMPSRAEVSDVNRAVHDGADAVMLSEETAVGDFPVQTVRQMAAILRVADQEVRGAR